MSSLNTTCGTNPQVNDLLSEVSSMSKIRRNSHLKTSPSSSSSYYGFLESHKQGCTKPQSKYGMGRGQYMDSLAARYNKGERTTELDYRLHEELQEINGLGYANDKIEERFGSPVKDFSSFLQNGHDDSGSLNKGEIDPQFLDSEPLSTNETVSKTVDPELNNIDSVSTTVDPELNNIDSVSTTVDYATSNQKMSESCITNSTKKKQPRKSRNLVVLAFTTNGIHKKLKPPDAYLTSVSSETKSPEKNSPWALANVSGSIFSPDEFPAL